LDNKINSSKKNKKEDGDFKKKNINHSPQAESSRAKFGGKGEIDES